MFFGQRLRYAMKIRDMSQADLVEKTGISKSGISQYLSGEFIRKITIHSNSPQSIQK